MMVMDNNSLIQILPENVANQIAAGEVVQRPASVVKELMENAIDAQATQVHLTIEDAGRTLLQVTDNGTGMSGRDLELAFERHATSKIRKAEDLFSIVTMGFRGEALASIAAVAQVEAHTRRPADELGWQIRIDGGKRLGSQQLAAKQGTSIYVRNLFFNIPARRNFLKSDSVEFRHISDEFQRVALAHPEVGFRLEHNGSTVYHLPSTNFRKRIVSLMGTAFDERLVPVQEQTPLLTVDGFVGKPEFARKTRGEQFLFVNERFVKSSSLHHSVLQAFEGLLPEGKHPAYFLKLTIDPRHIDINIHPTKTEIKFDDERSVYGLLKASVKHALGQFNIRPSIDFEVESSFRMDFDPDRPVRPPMIQVNPDFNPFTQSTDKARSGSSSALQSHPSAQHSWETNHKAYRQEELYQQLDTTAFKSSPIGETGDLLPWTDRLAVKVESERLLIIDLRRAHEKMLYDDYLRRLQAEQSVSQQLLFPIALHFKPEEIGMLRKLCPALMQMGFDLEVTDEEVVMVSGLPYGMSENGTKDALDELLEWEMQSAEVDAHQRTQHVAAAFARAQALKDVRQAHGEELQDILRAMNRMNWPDRNWDDRPIWWEILPTAIQD